MTTNYLRAVSNGLDDSASDGSLPPFAPEWLQVRLVLELENGLISKCVKGECLPLLPCCLGMIEFCATRFYVGG